jgi:TIR domain-containing protein
LGKQASGNTYDLFVNHAFADKRRLVGRLVRALKRRKIKTWYDDDFVTGGSHLLRTLNNAMKQSRHAIVVFSKAFLSNKRGVRDHEYHVLLSLQLGKGRQNLIIPVLYGVTKAQVSKYDATLGGRYHLDLRRLKFKGLVNEICRAVKPQLPPRPETTVKFIKRTGLRKRT